MDNSRLIVLGINHRKTPIQIREKLFLRGAERDFLLSDLRCNPAVTEALVLSTCNRTEIYAYTFGSTDEHLREVLRGLFDIKAIENPKKIIKYFYLKEKEEAIEHLLRVACGVDSLVLGENQILGQVKDAIARSKKRGMMGKYLNILSNIIVQTGKKVRHETDIGRGGSSVSWAAVSLAEKIVGSVNGKNILIIGAGKIGDLAINQLKNKGVKNIYIVNRTLARAKELARAYAVHSAGFSDIKELLAGADICLSAAGAPHYLIEKSTVVKARKNVKKPILFIDISVPRNIDPAVGKISDITLKTIDDLNEVVQENTKKRQAAYDQVRIIIDAKVNQFNAKINKLTSCKNPSLLKLTSGDF